STRGVTGRCRPDPWRPPMATHADTPYLLATSESVYHALLDPRGRLTRQGNDLLIDFGDDYDPQTGPPRFLAEYQVGPPPKYVVIDLSTGWADVVANPNIVDALFLGVLEAEKARKARREWKRERRINNDLLKARDPGADRPGEDSRAGWLTRTQEQCW